VRLWVLELEYLHVSVRQIYTQSVPTCEDPAFISSIGQEGRHLLRIQGRVTVHRNQEIRSRCVGKDSQPFWSEMSLHFLALGKTALRQEDVAAPEKGAQILIRTRIPGEPHAPIPSFHPEGQRVRRVPGPKRLDPKLPKGMFPGPSRRKLMNHQREPRLEDIGPVGSSQVSQVARETHRTQEGEWGLSRWFQPILEGKEKGGQFPHVIRMEMGDEEMGDLPPLQAETGQGLKGPGSTIQEEEGSPDLDPMGWRPTLRIRDQRPGTHHPHPHGQ
jgi:hypothetical protein